MADLIVTIDGPAASGKSTVARLLARKLGASFLDTGAMYRVVTLAAIRAGADLSDQRQLLDVMDESEFKFSAEQDKMLVFLDGTDVTERLRDRQVTDNARYIASAPKVRQKLVGMQRVFAATELKIVTEGRDQGTVAFADADIKFFLTAEPAERARRRLAEMPAGDGLSLEQVQSDIERRDKSDRDRAVGPLKPADDAIVVDTTDLNIDEVVDKLFGFVKEKCLKDG
ncbi:MAG: (d)CMP kinase [Sedimentisphaerales bacterium]|nr:(d)CMP kinase [Sedimentisphaerales bacterium]